MKKKYNPDNNEIFKDFLWNNKLTIIFVLLSFYFIGGCSHNSKEIKQLRAEVNTQQARQEEYFPKALKVITEENSFNAEQMGVLISQLKDAGFYIDDITSVKKIATSSWKTQYKFWVKSTNNSSFVIEIENDTGKIDELRVDIGNKVAMKLMNLNDIIPIIHNGERVDDASNYIVDNEILNKVELETIGQIQSGLVQPKSYSSIDGMSSCRYKNLYILFDKYYAKNLFNAEVENNSTYVYAVKDGTMTKLLTVDNGKITYQVK